MEKKWVVVIVVVLVLAFLVIERRMTFEDDPLHGEYCAVWEDCD